MTQSDLGGTHILYGDHRSGNCYKAALMLSLTGRDYDWREVDVLAGESRTLEFLARNPNGRVPLLQLPDGRLLAESNAMLIHLAEGTDWLPQDAYERALVFQWLFFEQYSHEPYIAVARFLHHFDHGQELDPARMRMLEEKGYEALGVMEKVLTVQQFIAGSAISIADIALYAYSHVAADGGYDLSDFPMIQHWLQAIASQDGHFDLVELAA